MSLSSREVYMCLSKAICHKIRIGALVLPLTVAVMSAMMPYTALAETWKVNLQEADIKGFINEVATITGKNFVPDPRINGNITVISQRAMTEAEVYDLFLSVMRVNGITAIERNGLVELLPDNVAKQSGVAVDIDGTARGEQMVTRVIYLSSSRADEVLSVIRPIMPQSAHAAAVGSVNALVLSDRADSLNQLTALIRDLDSNVSNSVSVIPLQHTDAQRMLELLSGVTEQASQGQDSLGSRLTLTADPASDRLIVMGNPEQIAKIQALVNRLDTVPTRRLSGVRTFRLNYADALQTAEILRALLGGQSINSAETQSTLSTASLSNGSSAMNNSGNVSTGSNGGSSTNAISGGGEQNNGRRYSIIANETQNAIIVNAPNELMMEIEDTIMQMDIKEPQVLIQAAIIEISGDDARQLGVQWALGSANSGYGVVNFDNAGVSATTLATAALSKSATAVSGAASAIAGALLGFGNSRQRNGSTEFYGAILQALDRTTSANLLSTPSIMTLNNKEAKILVGQNVPFVTGSYNTNSNNSNPFQTVSRQDVGIQLNVKPRVGRDGTVRLEVSQEVSAVVPGSTNNINGLVTNKSFIDTTIMAKDGQTVALGGLMRDNTTNSAQKVPGLGDIPMLGRLFRSDGKSNQKSNLIIFLQPTVLYDSAAVASMTEKRNNQLITMQLVIDSNGTIKKIPLKQPVSQYPQMPVSVPMPITVPDKSVLNSLTHDDLIDDDLIDVTPNQPMAITHQQPITAPKTIQPAQSD